MVALESRLLRLLSLITISLLAAGVWHFEVEARDPKGLHWITYNHLAIPVSGILFLGWVFACTGSSSPRWGCIAWAGGWGIVTSLVLEWTATLFFAAGLSALQYEMILSPLMEYRELLLPAIWCSTLLTLYAGCLIFIRFPVWCWPVGLILWISSWPLGCLLLELFPGKYPADLIHSLKSGWMIPFTVFAAGLPVVFQRKKPGSQADIRLSSARRSSG